MKELIESGLSVNGILEEIQKSKKNEWNKMSKGLEYRLLTNDVFTNRGNFTLSLMDKGIYVSVVQFIFQSNRSIKIKTSKNSKLILPLEVSQEEVFINGQKIIPKGNSVVINMAVKGVVDITLKNRSKLPFILIEK